MSSPPKRPHTENDYGSESESLLKKPKSDVEVAAARLKEVEAELAKAKAELTKAERRALEIHARIELFT